MSLVKLYMKTKSMSTFNVSWATSSRGLLSEPPREEQEPNGLSPKQILANKHYKISKKALQLFCIFSKTKNLYIVWQVHLIFLNDVFIILSLN